MPRILPPSAADISHDRIHPVYRGTAVAFHLLHITHTDQSGAMRELAHAALGHSANPRMPKARAHGDADTPTWERIGAYAEAHSHPQATRYNWNTAARRSALDKELYDHLAARHGEVRVDDAVRAAHARLLKWGEGSERLSAALQRLHRDLGGTRAAGVDRLRELHHAIIRLSAYATDRVTLRRYRRDKAPAHYIGDTAGARKEAGLDGRRRDPLKLSDIEYRGSHKAPGPTGDLGSSLDNLSAVYPEDIYGSDAARLYGHYGGGSPVDAASIRVIQYHRGRPHARLRVYRAVPDDAHAAVIHPGDWVTINRKYASEHGRGPLRGRYKILSAIVRAGDLYTNGDSIHEWGWHPTTPPTRLSRRNSRPGLAQAMKALRAAGFAAVANAARRVAAASGERAAVVPVVAHHPELGYHPAAMLSLDVDDPRVTKYLAAWHGLTTRHSSLIHFTVASDGPDSVHTIRVPHPPEVLARHLVEAGVTKFSLRVRRSGGSIAHVYDPGHNYQFDTLVRKLNGRSSHTRGRGERVSASAPTADTAAHRAHYREAIRATERAASGAPQGARVARLSLPRRSTARQVLPSGLVAHHITQSVPPNDPLMWVLRHRFATTTAAKSHWEHDDLRAPKVLDFSFETTLPGEATGSYTRRKAEDGARYARVAGLGDTREIFRRAMQRMANAIKRHSPDAIMWSTTGDGDGRRERLYHLMATRMARPRGYTLFHLPAPTPDYVTRYVLAKGRFADALRATRDQSPSEIRKVVEKRQYRADSNLGRVLTDPAGGAYKRTALRYAAQDTEDEIRRRTPPIIHELPDPERPRVRLSRLKS